MRYWLRSGIPGSRGDNFKKWSGLLVRLAVVAAYSQIGISLGAASLRHAANGLRPVEWMLAGLLGFSASWGMLTRARALRGMTLPLGSSLIDTLPASDWLRTTVELFEVVLAHVVSGFAFMAAAPSLPRSVSFGLAIATSLAASAIGAALMRWVFVLLPPERALTAAQIAMITQGVFLGVGFMGALWDFEAHPAFLAVLARPLAGEGGLGAASACIALAFGLAMVALSVAERVGYDKVEVVPQRRFADASRNSLAVGAIDELLARREPGGRRWPLVLFGALLPMGLAVGLVVTDGQLGIWKDSLPPILVGYTGWLAIPTGSILANRAVARDLVARPLLASLPIDPRELLDGKVAVVRRRLVIGLAPLSFVLLAPLPWDVLQAVAWRTASVGAALFIYGSAAVSIAFLTGGAQSARPQPGGSFRLETLLLFTPLGAVFLAANFWLTLVPIACLALVSFEARRAAMRVVRWLDDGEDFYRETPAWRAALAFATFQAAQVLSARFAAGWIDDPGVVVGSSYAMSALVLAGLTLYGRRDLAPIRAWPKNPIAIVVGLAGGIGTATLARLFVRFMAPSEMAPDRALLSTRAGQVAFALAAGALAPLVEEFFFRGWLQSIVAREVGPARKWLAPVITALAFALVHPPQSFPAVLLLGLLAGALYARTSSLSPSIFAHMAHNWAVVFLP
jgi:membrane protease YdiL (CAAX protease family)